MNFRDYLRSNELARSEYQQLKLNLSNENKNDKHKYAEGKTEFVKSILDKDSL
ncbi:GrpB family protein [Salmonella enterica]|uniref:GrpB family protein n=1 Tax=Salmonella enterica TaxID=28901 RepID=UPI0034D29791